MKLNELLKTNTSAETSIRNIIDEPRATNPIAYPLFSKSAADIFTSDATTNKPYYLIITPSETSISFNEKSISYEQFRLNGFTDLINQF